MKPMPTTHGGPTILLGNEADLEGNLLVHPIEHGAKQFDVTCWNSPGDCFRWEVDTDQPGEYQATFLIQGFGAQVVLTCGTQKLSAKIDGEWDRVQGGTICLAAGKNVVELRSPVPGKKLALYSLELITPEGQVHMDRLARELRASTRWMRAARYGLQFHWTSQSQPRRGAQKPYRDAVRDFDTWQFAQMIRETGAGYVILTTSHAGYYFPTPIRAIDCVLPGRIADRDLIRDLIDSLGQYGIRLLLYYHPGHDDFADPRGWWQSTGYRHGAPDRFLAAWCAIIGEVGERYGPGLAGWFFDDGCFYYPNRLPFEALTRAAKAGNPDRVICYNPWIWPRFTDLQDYFCGEGYEFLKAEKHLPADGNGLFIAGPHQGLQAHTNFILEQDWCHWQPDSLIPAPQVAKETFVTDMAQAIARGIVPSVNLEIYQDGTVSEVSLDYMRAVKEAIEVS
jgi:hypothetical protein